MLIVDSDEEGPSNNADISEEERSRKRKLDEKESVSAKRSRIEQAEELDEVIALDWTEMPLNGTSYSIKAFWAEPGYLLRPLFQRENIDTSDLKMVLLPLKAFILLELLETLQYAVLKVGI